MPHPDLPYGRQWVDEEDIATVAEVLRGDYLTTGPAVDAFETALAGVCGRRHGVAVSSGTAALHVAYFAFGVGPGKTVVTSPLTFAATANAALYLGAEVRFADVEEDRGTLDPERAAEALAEGGDLLVPVDFAGHPSDYPALTRVADDAGVPLVTDAAHSLGASLDGRPALSHGDAAVTSFHPVKVITTAEGGALVTDDPEVAERARRFRSHGIERDPQRQVRPEGPWHQEMHDLGFNYRLSDVQAALGRSQLRRLDAFLERRRQIAERYADGLGDLSQLRLPSVTPGAESAWHLYVVRVTGDPERRRPFFERLRALGLGVQVHYLPVHLHPFYRRLGYRPGLCPVAEDFYRRAVSLPLFPAMTDADVDSSIERVRRAVAEEL